MHLYVHMATKTNIYKIEIESPAIAFQGLPKYISVEKSSIFKT